MARTKNPYIPDEELDAEIERLKKSPDVKLAQKYRRALYRRRIYLSELRCAERQGKELRANGITEEVIDGAYEPDYENRLLVDGN